MKKNILIIFAVLLFFSFIGCANRAKSKIVGIEWVAKYSITPKTVKDAFTQLKLEKDGSIICSYKVKDKEVKTMTGTYTIEENTLVISFPENKEDSTLNEEARWFNGFYQFKVEGNYLLMTSNIVAKDGYNLLFIKKDALKDWAKS